LTGDDILLPVKLKLIFPIIHRKEQHREYAGYYSIIGLPDEILGSVPISH
jgi:hypothetical protein